MFDLVIEFLRSLAYSIQLWWQYDQSRILIIQSRIKIDF